MRALLSTILIAAGSAALATAQHLPPLTANPWYPSPDGGGVLNIAHRGGAREFPDNTLFGYHESRAAGADMLEMDIYETADGHLVVIHDATVDRTTNGSGSVSDLTLDELKALDAAYWFVPDVGTAHDRSVNEYVYRGVATGVSSPPPGYEPSDFTIPTLEKVLIDFPDMLINIELKPDPGSTGSYEGKLAALLAKYGRGDDVIVASFLDTASAVFKLQALDVPTSVPTVQVALSTVLATGPLTGFTVGHVAFQVPIGFAGLEVLNQEFVDDAHARGMAVHAWTINDCDDMKWLLGLGVDGIMTDRPEYLEEILIQFRGGIPPADIACP